MQIDRRTMLLGAAGTNLAPVPDFGLRGDGSDETDKLQALADYLGRSGASYALPPGRTFLHSRGIILGGGGFQLDGSGSTIKMMDGVIADAWHFGLQFTAENFGVRNLIVDGNRQNRIPREIPCHSFYLRGAVRGRFDRCSARNAVCDGWIIWEKHPSDPTSWCREIVLNECSADNSFRNGLSIINGYDIQVIGGSYSRSNGTSPQAGIDLEADPGGPEPSMDRIAVRGVQAIGNSGPGFVISPVGKPGDVEWTDLSADGAGTGIHAVGFRINSNVRSSGLKPRNYRRGANIQSPLGIGLGD